MRDRVRRSRRGAGRVGATLAALGLLGLSCAPTALAEAAFTADESAGPVTGLATDTAKQVYWTAAKSSGTVTALGPDGKAKGQVTYGATPTDVEAVSFRDGRLWIGDIGDVEGSRSSVTVYRIGAFDYGTKAPYRSYTLSYADKAQDSGAMTVSPKGRLYVVTRSAKPGIYRAPATMTAGGPVNKLTRVGDAPANVTDVAFTADGTKLVLRTLTSVHVYYPFSFEQTASAALPDTVQGLAITPSLTGEGLLVSGTGSPVPVERITLPTTVASIAPAPATPAPSPSPSASAAARSTGASPKHSTLWALLAAAAISLVAALVVVVKR